jgi:LysM repeat protein
VLTAPTQNVGATATAYAQRSIPTPSPPGQYIVKPGDTLSKIADAFATTVDEIMAVNNLGDPNLIEVGQRLIIPPSITATDTPAEPALEQTGTPPAAAPVPVPSLVSP